MVEAAPQPLEGKALLLARGVPKELLGLMSDNGGMIDYLNEYVGAWMHISSRYNPRDADNHLADADAGKTLRQVLRRILTYKQYWRARIAKYNKEASAHGLKRVKPRKTLVLVME